ncbi:MAG TPA: HAD family hydrolase [Patescibacteria group bacterium]|jgi:FMN phosphatase YigB (HAD superfamily)|nr:HAD family hydrolase [Patescibacteria group bacterium]
MPLIVLIFLGFVTLCFFFMHHTYNNVHYNINQPVAHNKTLIILWDIHGVLFEKNRFRWLYIIVTYPHLFSVLKKLDKKIIIILLKYCGKKVKILKEEITNQELINYAQKINNHALIDLTIQVSCAYQPKNDVIALVAKLHEQGYAQHIGSNIGKSIFELFAPQHPTIFTYFSYLHIINTQHATTVIKKPNKEFFLSYLDIHKKLPQEILFIDDRWANVKAARACGLQAIYFENSLQLQKEFEYLGLFKKKNELI